MSNGCPSCGSSRCCTPQRGERGLKGEKGDTGATGPAGATGAQGPAGADGNDAVVPDSGWVALEGFDHYTGSMATEKPECRLIGKVLYFRGQIYIPLSNDGGTTLVNLSSGTAYEQQYYKEPYVGAGGVTLVSAGAIQLNKNAAVVPASVLAGSLDDSYSSSFRIATRQIYLDAQDGTALTTVVKIIISSDKKMTITVAKDVEELSTIAGAPGNRGIGTSQLQYLISNVLTSQYVRDFRTATGSADTISAVGADAVNQSVSSDAFQGDLTAAGILFPFNCNAGLETDLAGFVINLDGFQAFTA